MENLSTPVVVFIIAASAFQFILIWHFAHRKLHFELAVRNGWIVYAAGIPAALVSIYLLRSGLSWYFWFGGFVYLVWSIFGFTIEYIQKIKWRSPVQWSVFGPYITLYLFAVMFYWWPLALIYKPLWYIYGALFIVSTALNVTSHRGSAQLSYKDGVL